MPTLEEMLRLQEEFDDLVHHLSDEDRYNLRVPIDTLTIKTLLNHEPVVCIQLKQKLEETIAKIKNKK